MSVVEIRDLTTAPSSDGNAGAIRVPAGADPGCRVGRVRTAEDFAQLETKLRRVEAQRDAALKEAKNERASADMYANAWVRELGGKLIPKAHHIDACVLTTRQMRQRLEKLEAEDRARRLADQIAEYGPFVGKRRGDW